MGLKVLNDNVLIKRDEIKKYEGAIVLPDIYEGAVNKISPEGTIIGIGPKVENKEIKIGDKVYFQQFGGTKIIVDKVEHWVMKEHELLGIVND